MILFRHTAFQRTQGPGQRGNKGIRAPLPIFDRLVYLENAKNGELVVAVAEARNPASAVGVHSVSKNGRFCSARSRLSKGPEPRTHDCSRTRTGARQAPCLPKARH